MTDTNPFSNNNADPVNSINPINDLNEIHSDSDTDPDMPELIDPDMPELIDVTPEPTDVTPEVINTGGLTEGLKLTHTANYARKSGAQLMKEALNDPESHVNKVLKRATTRAIKIEDVEAAYDYKVMGIFLGLMGLTLTIAACAQPQPPMQSRTSVQFGPNGHSYVPYPTVNKPKCNILRSSIDVLGNTQGTAISDAAWLLDRLFSKHQLVRSRIIQAPTWKYIGDIKRGSNANSITTEIIINLTVGTGYGISFGPHYRVTADICV